MIYKKENSPVSTIGDSCIFEAREQFSVDQLIATTMISSFIECNLHPHLNPLTPVIMLGAPEAQICLYDSENDVLLLSDVFNWITSSSATSFAINKPCIVVITNT